MGTTLGTVPLFPNTQKYGFQTKEAKSYYFKSDGKCNGFWFFQIFESQMTIVWHICLDEIYMMQMPVRFLDQHLEHLRILHLC